MLPVLALGGVAVGDADLARDADDTRGRLDVKQIRHGHGTRMGLLRHRIAMHGEWGTRVLRRKGAGELYLIFSTRGNNCAEQRVKIVKRDGELSAFIQAYDPVGCGRYDDSGAMSEYVALDAEIDRRRGRDIIVTFDKRDLRKKLDDYSWSVMTILESQRCNDSCIDYGPDDGKGVRGVLVHDLG